MLFARNIFLLSFCLVLAACGFKPLYGLHKNGNIGAAFDNIYIENIPDSEGLSLRNNLIDRFYTHGRPDKPYYSLSIQKISETKKDLDITKSADATRAQLRLSTVMTLKVRDTGETVLKRQLLSVTSYNILRSQFTTHISEKNARKSALDDLANQIETQLSLYFDRTL